jgi:adenylylsulfate kinase
MIVWFTGLSGSGKSTLADALCEKLHETGRSIEHLDGDALRVYFPKTGFSREERHQHIRRAGYIASLLEKHGVIVVASFISPYEESRKFVKEIGKDVMIIHVDTPIEICEKRDPKGLYKKARAGEIKQFTGLDDPYERPVNPDLRIRTDELSVSDAVHLIYQEICRRIPSVST